MLSTRHYTIPVFIPELACPFQCAFCNQQKISGQLHIPDHEEIINTINEYLNSFTADKRYVEVGFFGGSFTGINIDEQRKYLETVQPFLQNGQVQSIRLSTRPEYISNEILDVLKEMNVGTIELGAQSFDDGVLKNSIRGHSSAQIEKAAAMIRSYGFKLGLQMMIGLPGDTFEKAMYTAGMIVKNGADNTRIYPALVIKDTLMHKWFKEGKYKPLSMDEAILWTSRILLFFEQNNINIIRVGLHPSEGLVSGDELIAGPFHPSFKELVLSHIWRENLENQVSVISNDSITIEVNPKEINHAIGYEKINKLWLLEKYRNVSFVQKPVLKGRNFKILES